MLSTIENEMSFAENRTWEYNVKWNNSGTEVKYHMVSHIKI